MLNENICRFISHSGVDTIETINYILETKHLHSETPHLNMFYQVAYVLEGEAVLHTEDGAYPLRPGDVFFRFPAKTYSLEPGKGFKYLYISFAGSYTYSIMDRFHIHPRNFLFHGLYDLAHIWTGGITSDPMSVDVAGTGVLLYTLSRVSQQTPGDTKTAGDRSADVVVSTVMQFIDSHYDDSTLTVKGIAGLLNYNDKYVSTVFHRRTGMRIRDYLTSVRNRHARLLMEQNISSVQNIAYLCGYNDPLYFSRVFKQENGVSPREYIALLTARQNTGGQDGTILPESGTISGCFTAGDGV